MGATIASTSTLAGVEQAHLIYSSRGESAGGIALFAVTGNIVVENRVRRVVDLLAADGARIVLVGVLFSLDRYITVGPDKTANESQLGSAGRNALSFTLVIRPSEPVILMLPSDAPSG